MLEVEGRYLGSQKSGQVPFSNNPIKLSRRKWMRQKSRELNKQDFKINKFGMELRAFLNLKIDIKINCQCSLLSWPGVICKHFKVIGL